MAKDQDLKAGFTGTPRDPDSISAKASDAARAVKDEAIAARDAASEHPHSLSLFLALVGIGAFLLGRAAGYRQAEIDLAPPIAQRRHFW